MSLITEDAIILAIEGTNKSEILHELGNIALRLRNITDEVAFTSDLNKREGEMSTGFGHGIAIPHAKSAAVKTPGIIFARTTQNIEWQALDDQPVNCFICLMSPIAGDNVHLKMLSKLSRKLVHPEFVTFLKTENDATVIYSKLTEILEA